MSSLVGLEGDLDTSVEEPTLLDLDYERKGEEGWHRGGGAGCRIVGQGAVASEPQRKRRERGDGRQETREVRREGPEKLREGWRR